MVHRRKQTHLLISDVVGNITHITRHEVLHSTLHNKFNVLMDVELVLFHLYYIHVLLFHSKQPDMTNVLQPPVQH